jgi:hypothetical protein
MCVTLLYGLDVLVITSLVACVTLDIDMSICTSFGNLGISNICETLSRCKTAIFSLLHEANR